MAQNSFFPYGREADVSELVGLLTTGRRPVLLRGPSGIGKSEVMRAVAASLRLGGDELALLHSVASPAHSIGNVIADLMRQILASSILPSLNSSHLAGTIVRIAKDSSWAVAAAMLLNLTDRLVPGTRELATTLATQVHEELSKSIPSAMIERMREDIHQDLPVGLLNILEAIAELGSPGVILIDQAESSSESVRDALLGIALQMPSSWCLLMAINDEIPEGIDFLNAVWPRLAYARATQKNLGPLRASDLDTWCLAVRASTPSSTELEAVTSHCQGRPLLLREWVNGASSEAELNGVWQRLGPYYQQRLNSLSKESRSLLRTLSLLPDQSTFSLDLITSFSRSRSTTVAFELIEELMRSQFLEQVRGEDSYRFVHDVTRRQVLSATPKGVIREAATDLLAAFRSRKGQDEPQQSYTIARLEYAAENYLAFAADALPAANALLASGSYAPALRLFREYISLELISTNSDQKLEARLGAAAALYSTGYYHEGLDMIQGSESWPAIAGAQGLLMQGRLMLRLSRFEAARYDLELARKRFAGLGNVAGILRCDKEVITVLRDLGEYEEASRRAILIRNSALSSGAPVEILASCHRAVARSLAFTGPFQDALTAAEEALSVARKTGSPSDAGNSRLARGEVLRLGCQPDNAIPDYEAAANTALTLGDRDSYLWSVLGLSDCMFMLGDHRRARNELARVEEIVSLASDRYPLVHLHWRLSQLSILHVNGNSVNAQLDHVVQEYAELGITWPREYASRLSDSEALPKRFG